MSVPILFLIIAPTFCTASFAISPSLPAAIILPSSLLCEGAASAAIGNTIPLESPIIANPFTHPILDPCVENTL